MSTQPLISVIISTYNRWKKLINRLKSVFANTCKNIEVIVINDNPEENLKKALKNFNSKLVKNKNEKYVPSSKNDGAKMAKPVNATFLNLGKTSMRL
ncbi:MAG: glycosyltransferase [Candidatus Micrarchaeaceae archaeon]